MSDFLPYLVLFLAVSTLLYFYLKKPRDFSEAPRKPSFFSFQKPHGWRLYVIKTDEFNSDGTYRPSLIEHLNASDRIQLAYDSVEKKIEVLTPFNKTVGYLPKSATERVKNYLANHRIGEITVARKRERGDHTELLIEIEVKP
ncbi:MAG: hypothetical protein AB9921_08020 [Erysipelotrichaceae bacterium]